ncbi:MULTISPECIES: IS481 family transposase [unclassified Pseudomonas]|uniref:Transposase n=1 Tax=Pseudomonas fluorescens TaxID=294 RepID=A0A161Z5V1_PSEFL|nr:IS481 family transposase [Pseudomonas fluorescens]KZN16772.1 transposase [Pseudomonas fluorescens]KZN18080.1 transposase [Pseudomonas fluorescens]
MPWNRESPMDQRVKLVGDWMSGAYSKCELARHYGVSRPTLDKWLARYAERGIDGLKELSRRPHHSPHQISEHVLELLIAYKREHPSWGPEKLVHNLKNTHAELSWPALSTAGEWLKRAGLVQKRRFLNRPPTGPIPLREATEPNQTWAADFKGDFALQSGQRCFPLTISDHVSRFLLLCRAQSSVAGAREGFDWAFREYGLPNVIRTDNGSPFASTGVSRISSLAAWFIRLGIYPERIQPGRPDQNGRHERMHRTLKAALLQTPEHNLVQQQLAFERFRHEYNYERPHKALAMKVPADVYVPSSRLYDGRVPEVNYPSQMLVRKVRQNGSMKWKGGMVFVSESLVGEALGLKEVEDEVWEVYLCNYLLGRLKSGENRLSNPQKRKGCPRSRL